MTQLGHWSVLDEATGLVWREYFFARGARATVFAVRGVDGGLIVVSPSVEPDPAVLDELATHGPVRALVANNAAHHFGQAAWRARFPEAVSYAAASALPQLAKKAPGVAFRPLAELPLPDHVRADEVPESKIGEIVFRIRTARGPVWSTGDLMTNIQKMPAPMSWIFRALDIAPGFRLFKPAIWFFVSDRAALRERLAAWAAEDPPAVVIPAHGPPVTGADVAEQVRGLLARL